jgi:hypothetical protein
MTTASTVTRDRTSEQKFREMALQFLSKDAPLDLKNGSPQKPMQILRRDKRNVGEHVVRPHPSASDDLPTKSLFHSDC